MTRLPEELLMQLLDAELADEEREKLLDRVHEDPESLSLLQFDVRVRELLSQRAARGASDVPQRFADRVMRRIVERAEASATLEQEVPRDGHGGRVRGWTTRLRGELFRPRTLVFRPVHALVAVSALAVVGAVLLLNGGRTGAGRVGHEIAVSQEPGAGGVTTRGPGQAVEAFMGEDTVLVRFVYESEGARSVAVAGDFTRWEPIALERRRRDGRSIWSAVVAVPRGEHRYMFVVDGSDWVTDPLAAAVADDGFGHRNAILSL